jgi:uracil-DNA glycosylase
VNKQLALDQIKADIVEQNICPNLAQKATNLVFGDGNPNADIVFIGEAPGKKEDEQGLPFVGASGKFLGEMLSSIHMRREQVYITNIVKYRPPNNRDPLPEEKAAFLPFLERQLEVIDPLLIVTLGRHSMNCFLPGLQISLIHGEPKRIKMQTHNDQNDVKTRVILPLYHPAAALYNGGLRQALLEDFQNIPKTLELIRKEM